MIASYGLQTIVEQWMERWNDHDLDAVMTLFHEDASFVSWSGQRIKGKKSIRRAWADWFRNHGNFVFSIELVATDEAQQVVTIQWQLVWPSHEQAYLNKKELRKGVDIVHFKDGLIVLKKSYCQTVLIIDTEKVCLHL